MLTEPTLLELIYAGVVGVVDLALISALGVVAFLHIKGQYGKKTTNKR